MKVLLLFYIFFCCTTVSAKKDLMALSALDKARIIYQNNRGFKTEVSEIELLIIDEGGETVRRSVSQRVLETKEGARSVFEFIKPVLLKGTKLLTHSLNSRDNEQWLWLPSAKSVRRIIGGQRQNSFMGSEFSFEDLSEEHFTKFTYKDGGQKKIDGLAVFILEKTPIANQSAYSKQIVTYDTSKLVALRIEYYNRRRELIKIGTTKEIRKIGKWWRPWRIEMENVKNRRKSIMIIKNQIFGAELDGSEFSPQRIR
ncbi:MAG: outer membrane lipoprotein-sorting protein [Pseudobdellovibrionaceae bacterium]